MTIGPKALRRSLLTFRNNLRRIGPRYVLILTANFFLALAAIPRRAFRDAMRKAIVPAARRVLVPVLERLGIKRPLRRLLPPKNKVRRYINPELGIAGAISELNRRGVRYVVLRWFEDFPDWPAGEDMDFIVADEDFGLMEGPIVRYESSQAVDVYTVSARSGWNGMPCYPPHLARKMLETRVDWRGCWVPGPREHFLSLCYHIVYHKAEASGLPVTRSEWEGGILREERYTSIIRRLGDALGISYTPCLEDILRILEQEGWHPPVDTLRKLSLHSPWLRALVAKRDAPPGDGELLVFVVRETAIRLGFWDFILKYLQDPLNGLEFLWSGFLTPVQKERATESIRGGEWGKGPFPRSGGPPAAFIVAFDYHPIPCRVGRNVTHPYVRNERAFLKEKVRDAINRMLLRTHRMNSIHGSDDETEAWDYLESVFEPSFVDSIRLEVDQRREAYKTPERVIRTLPTIRTRAKVEIVDWHGQLAVRKTFKSGYERFANREVGAYQTLGGKHPWIPKLLEYGENFLILPFFENSLKEMGKSAQMKELRRKELNILDFLFFVYSEGYFLIDFNPSQLILTPQGEIKVIDFEFFHAYDKKPDSFFESYDLVGVPLEFKGDMPRGYKPRSSYRKIWRGILRSNIASHGALRQRYLEPTRISR